MKKIGFFGGTFDPLHFGHLNLAISLAEHHRLDQVLFCPVNRSPFKEIEPAASAEHRIAMTLLGIQGLPHFQICTLEIERGGISYTIDTLRALKKLLGNAELHLMLSEDSVESFNRWKDAEEILLLAKPLVGTRVPSKKNLSPSLLSGLTPTPIMEISSTEIRNRLKKNLPCLHLVPAMILDYIKRHRLY